MDSLRSSLLTCSLQVPLLNAFAIVGFLLLCTKKGKGKKGKDLEKTSAEPKSISNKSNQGSKKIKRGTAAAQVENEPMPPPVVKPAEENKPVDGSKSVADVKSVAESKSAEVVKSVADVTSVVESKPVGGSKQVGVDKSQTEGLPIDDKQQTASAAKPVESVKSVRDSSYLLQVGEQKNKLSTAMLRDVLVQPGSLRFTNNGGQGKITLDNKTGKRMAIKMKSSDNNLYRINPVFAFIDQEGNAIVEVTRSSGVPKPEKLQVVYVEAPEGAQDAENVFKSKPSGEKCASIPVLVS